ncbi:MAG: MoxR family ATPase [Verrucomicrobiota bacterium]
MRPSEIIRSLETLIATQWPVFLWGPPGVGKSSVVRQVASTASLEVIDMRAPLLDPTDLRGLPAVENGRAQWCPPAFLPHEESSRGILFFDELNAAPPLVQASLYQLTLDRRIGEYRLPAGWKIIAAGNRSTDASVVFRMPAALANRFIHMEFEADFEDWRNWAQSKDIHPLVVAFLSLRRELLFDMKKPERGFPTPRTWEMLSDVVRAFGKPDLLQLPIYTGTVGEGAAIEFLSYCRESIGEEEVRKILKNPERAALPSKLSDQYALIAYIPALMKHEDFSEAAATLLNRIQPELAILLLRNLMRQSKKFARLPGVRKFMAAHSEIIL